jgi:hypothetical protein
MHMTPDLIIAGFILVAVAVVVLFLRLAEMDDDQAEQAGPPGYEPRHDATVPRQALPLDPFSWAATEAIVEREHERLATTGEMRKLYERPCPVAPAPGQLRTTGELRALAYAGETETIAAIVDAWKNDIDDEELSA